jgi:hypothetical protein
MQMCGLIDGRDDNDGVRRELIDGATEGFTVTTLQKPVEVSILHPLSKPASGCVCAVG